MNWSLIIFAYNEGGNLELTVERCVAFLASHAAECELIVVDDGSTDDTPTVCDRLVAQHPMLRVIRQKANHGIGMALRTGYAEARHEFVCAIPGDGQFDPDELKAVRPFGPDRFYSFYRTAFNYTPYRQMLSSLNRLFNRLFLDLKLRDVNWIKVYRSDQLRKASPRLTSSIIESEICANLVRQGCQAIELPSVYGIREHGEAKGGRWKTVQRVLAEMPQLYLRRRPR